MNSENKIIVAILISAIAIMVFQAVKIQVHAQMNVEDIATIDEDQVIICVSGQLSDPEVNGIICHLDPIDNVDWYQEIDNIRDHFANLNDSFGVKLAD